MSCLLFSEDKIKLTNGSFMSGTIVKVSDKGVKMRVTELDSVIEFKWEDIALDTKKKLKKKYGIGKASSQTESKEKKDIKEKKEDIKKDNKKVDLENKEKEQVKDSKKVISEKPAYNFRFIARLFYDSYLRNLKTSIRDLSKGHLTDKKEGHRLTLKDGSVLKGELSRETDLLYVLRAKNQTMNVKKELVVSSEKISIRVVSGTVKKQKLLGNAGVKLHEKMLEITSGDFGLTLDQAEMLWKKRITGGILEDGKYNGSFIGHRSKRSISLGKTSFLFISGKGKVKTPSFPKEKKWWDDLSSREKENILLAHFISKIFPITRLVPKQCSKCKGNGVLNKKQKKKSTKNKKKTSTEIGGGDDSSSKKKKQVCPDCRGMKKQYSLKYE